MPDNKPVLTPLLVDEATAARLIGLTTRFLRQRRRKGNGPPFVRISSRCVRYEPDMLRAWAMSLRRTSTSDSGAPPIRPRG